MFVAFVFHMFAFREDYHGLNRPGNPHPDTWDRMGLLDFPKIPI